MLLLLSNHRRLYYSFYIDIDDHYPFDDNYLLDDITSSVDMELGFMALEIAKQFSSSANEGAIEMKRMLSSAHYHLS